ncbi:MAG: VanW family protein [Clostridia bacterium]|nr:VanW family protein [Clostridia bacterium]
MGKRVLSFALALVMLVSAFSFTSFAEGNYISGDWAYTAEDGAATITAYRGEEKIINVPETLGTSKVVCIAHDAFANTIAKTVNLPLSVKEIQENAFAQPSVKAVYVPKSVKTIADNAFNAKVEVFSFSGTVAETYATDNSLKFIKIAAADYYDSYVGKKVYIDTPHTITLKALDSYNTISGRNIIGAKTGNGKVSITFTCGITAVLSVKVRATPKSITNLPKIVNLYIGDQKQLQPEISNGTYPDEFSFKSGNTAVATVTNGKIKGIAPGSTKVTVKYSNGISAEVPVNVGYETAHFNLDKKEVLLGVGETYKLTYKIGKNEAVKKIYYTSNNEKVATVAANGTITPKSVGVATITATTNNGLTDKCVVTVGKAPKSIKLAASSITLGTGEKVKFKVSVDSGAVCSTYIWRMDDTSIATVDANGVVTGKKAGTTYLYAYTYNYKSKDPYIRTYAKITVKKAPSSIGFNKTKIVLGVGEKFDLNVKLPANSNCYKKTVKMGNTSIASLGKNIVVQGKKVGTTKISITAFNGKKGYCTIVVKPAPVKVACKPASVKLALGQKYQLKPYVNTGAACSTYIYKTTNSKVCTVNQKGLVKVKDYGSCYIKIFTYNHTGKKPIVCKVKMQVGYITNKLEYYTTYFVESDYGKSHNIKMACKYINGNTDGYIIQPGEIFSVNQAIGPRNTARGFTEANVISGGVYVPGIGGGICQVATTCFNAALYADLEIIERWNHSLKSGYVPIGRDATISWGIQDFRFRNDYNTPIRLKMNYDPSGVLNCTIYSLAKVKLPKIKLDVTHSGGAYTLRRYSNGKCNYVTRSVYDNA